MNAVAQAIDHYLAQHAQAADSLAGVSASWLQESRRAAIRDFAARGFPTARDEDWKYTRTTAIERRLFGCAAVGDAAVDIDRIANLLRVESSGPCLVFINGRHYPALSRTDNLPAGATVASLNEVMRAHPERLQGVFGAVAELERHRFAALNAAFADEGVFIALAKNTVVEQPISAVFIATAALEGHVVQPRVLVKAEANTRATFIERYIALDEAVYFSNAVTEVVLAENAAIDYFRVQEESAKAFHISGVHVRQARDSRFSSHAITLGGAITRNDVDVRLAAPGASCTLNGLYMANGREHVDTHTRVDHLAPHCTSSEYYKGILDGHGRGVFNGKVIVHPDAQKSDARQSNKNLLLSADAEADTKPQLEIYADDVKCAHGATVGQLDADAVFYLRSRGMDEAAARSLITYAFAAEMIEAVAAPALRAYLKEAVLTRLPGVASDRELI